MSESNTSTTSLEYFINTFKFFYFEINARWRLYKNGDEIVKISSQSNRNVHYITW